MKAIRAFSLLQSFILALFFKNNNILFLAQFLESFEMFRVKFFTCKNLIHFEIVLGQADRSGRTSGLANEASETVWKAG